MTDPDPSLLAIQQAEKLKQWIRIGNPGGCRMLTLGPKCECPLCAVDHLLSLVGEQQQRIAELTAQLSALRGTP